VIDDDNIIDQFEVEIDDIAIHLLAKAPVATDLRLTTAAMKISQNLERVGDSAVTIARRAIDLGTEPQLKPYVDLPRMATMSLEMLRDAISAFINREPEKARAVVPATSRWTTSTASCTGSSRASWSSARRTSRAASTSWSSPSASSGSPTTRPTSPRTSSTSTRRSTSGIPAKNSMKTKILVVDDEPDALEVLGFKLREAGYTPIFAKDGTRAIAIAGTSTPT
jgi:CheY-like chemotaxis protein